MAMEEKGLIAVEAPERLIALAIEKGVSVETMEKLLAMRRELKQEAAKEAYFKALGAFQAECPVIEKTKAVKNKGGSVVYRYAPLESIVEQVRAILTKHGFSYNTDTSQSEQELTVMCVSHHVAGHSETTKIAVPIGSDYMTAQQMVGSARTFAMRYAFCNAFGILTGDEDTDARKIENGDAKPKADTDEMYKMKQVWLDKIRDVMMHEDFPDHVREEATEKMKGAVYTVPQLKTYYDNALKVLDKYQRAKAKKDDAPKEEVEALGDEEMFNQPLEGEHGTEKP
jgi:hypothetical protein